MGLPLLLFCNVVTLTDQSMDDPDRVLIDVSCREWLQHQARPQLQICLDEQQVCLVDQSTITRFLPTGDSSRLHPPESQCSLAASNWLVCACLHLMKLTKPADASDAAPAHAAITHSNYSHQGGENGGDSGGLDAGTVEHLLRTGGTKPIMPSSKLNAVTALCSTRRRISVMPDPTSRNFKAPQVLAA